MSLEIFEQIQPATFESVLFALKWTTLYMVYMIIGALIVPGSFRRLKINNIIKEYKINGLNLFLLTPILAFLLIKYKYLTFVPIITHFWSFFIAANIFAFSFSIFLFLYTKLVSSPDTDHVHLDYLPDVVSDFWFGIRRNPEFFGLDLKMFFYQPSLIGLYLIVMAFAEYQFNSAGQLSVEMMLFLAFWWFYLFFHYIKEEFMLYTWDIIAENFGFMLIWGDLVYLPFLYSISAWYMIDAKPLTSIQLYGIVTLFVVGHYVLRVSNIQKFQFKLKIADPNNWFYWWKTGKLVVLDNKVLCSGFWGLGRHLNYTGEIMVYLSISLLSGVQFFTPYILPFSLFLLLTQRAWRDEQRCKQKYGKLWDSYCKIARYRMIPYIY